MTSSNRNLEAAKAAGDDEFYTPREMIERELHNYPLHIFKNQSVLCNCDDPGQDKDDPRMSEFFRYFDLRFGSTDFGLHKLVGTRYSGSALFSGICGAKAYYRTITKDKNGNPEFHPRCDLQGDGGFDSAECVQFLRDCDIVVTNPPFSRFQDFIALLVAHRKKFIVIGNINAMKQKELFPLIQSGQIWLGAARCKGEFIRPDDTTASAAACWYTNLPHKRRENEELDLTAKYNKADYPCYDNYPAIEVAQVKDIPADYDGEMGVPITFLEKHNPRQFEIVNQPPPNLVNYFVGGKKKYARLIIKRTGA